MAARAGLFIATGCCVGGLAVASVHALRAQRMRATLRAAYARIPSLQTQFMKSTMRYALVRAYVGERDDGFAAPMLTWADVERIAHDPRAFNTFQDNVDTLLSHPV